jgi:predicted lipoprotein with Yx(FWY)xxD motif
VNRKIYGLALAAGVLAVAIAGCGGGSSSTSNSSESSSTSSAPSGDTSAAPTEPIKAAPNAEDGTTFVSLGNAGDLGMVLVDSKGMTLYDFHKDKGTQSSCYGACAEAWPPLLTEGEPQPSNGASAAMLGTTERKDGTTQVTYAGHPLYGFVEDKKPGEANGNDISAFGGEWYTLKGDGKEPEDKPAGDKSGDDSGGTTTGSTTTGSPGGY